MPETEPGVAVRVRVGVFVKATGGVDVLVDVTLAPSVGVLVDVAMPAVGVRVDVATTPVGVVVRVYVAVKVGVGATIGGV